MLALEQLGYTKLAKIAKIFNIISFLLMFKFLWSKTIITREGLVVSDISENDYESMNKNQSGYFIPYNLLISVLPQEYVEHVQDVQPIPPLQFKTDFLAKN